MSKDRENPKSEHEKFLHQNATDEKGAQKKDHFNQYGKQDEDRKDRGANIPDKD
ncbi:hypothetical protein [Psychroserpens sp. Hel_I_66]|uniref:hypothetical protein n=1 Tax=Psychroserpens sp. Hel_I_66 TaxID=1250004 RepID=UPI000A80843A|nr:hypothetical protein [Psychroserpens sp. Hel_I_66]